MKCCPERPSGSEIHRGKEVAAPALHRDETSPGKDAVALRGGKFLMGTSENILPDDGEKPARQVRVRPFRLDRRTVTNDRFARFVEETGYETEAERLEWSYVFHALLNSPDRYDGLPGAEWWRAVPGATWCQPEGPGSSIEEREEHPVVHVSWNDACAFAAWAGGRLPTEAEWEFAARGGLEGKRYPWGDEEPDDQDFQPCNIWQGRFPFENTLADGHLGTAPAESFEPNGYGLFNMVGNVWEWTADVYRVRSLRKASRANQALQAASRRYVLKGGSYLCHKSYCYRYRVAARSGNTPDSATGHTGLRLAYDFP